MAEDLAERLKNEDGFGSEHYSLKASSLQLIASEDCESGLTSQMAAFFDDIRADAVTQQGVVNEFHLPLMEPMASEGVDLSQALQDLLAQYRPEPVRHASLSLQGGPVVQHTLSSSYCDCCMCSKIVFFVFHVMLSLRVDVIQYVCMCVLMVL